MKLFANQQVYLQNFDLAYMIREKKQIPEFVIKEIQEQLPPGAKRIDLTHEFDFAWVFKTLTSISWLMSRSYILDFGELMYGTLNDLEQIQTDAYDAWTLVENYADYIKSVAPDEIILEPSDYNEIIYSAEVMKGQKIGTIEFSGLPENYEEAGYYPMSNYHSTDECYPEEDYYDDEDDECDYREVIRPPISTRRLHYRRGRRQLRKL